MSDAAKERVLRQYSSVGDAYTRSAEHVSGNDLDRLVASTQPASADRVLDIATGGGHVAKAFAPLVREVVASDLTPAMLVGAEQFIAKSGFANVEYAIADAEDLPFPDSSFDIVTCRIAPHHFPNPGQFVKEVARVLKPGGRFGLVDSIVPDGELGTLFNQFELARDPSHVRSLTLDEWSTVIRDAGMHVETVEVFPKRHVFVDWTDRANVPEADRERIAAILLDSGLEVRETFQMEFEDGTLTAFTDKKALFVARRN